MVILTTTDMMGAVAAGGLNLLRARDVPPAARTRFEVGRSGLTGVVAWVTARQVAHEGELPSWAPAAMGAGTAALAFSARGFTQRTEDALDRGLARVGVRRPRVVLAVGMVALQLAAAAHERRTREQRARAQGEEAQASTDDMSS